MTATFDPNRMPLPKDSTPDDVKALYDEFATKYDEYMAPEIYCPGVIELVKTFAEEVSDVDKNIRIIDLGAGTGNAGLELKKHGFFNIDGLDISSKMLGKAKEKGVYKNYILAAVTEEPLHIETAAYDGVICAQAITSGYIKANAFDEILRLVKPGGYIAFTIRDDAFEIDDFGYAAKFQQFVNEGKWILSKKYPTDYVIGYDKFMNKCYVISYKVLKNE